MTGGILEVLGMKVPIIADIGDGYHLVAHPNGPAIATRTSLATLEMAIPDPKEGELFPEDDWDIPVSVGRKAIRAYVDWSWSQVDHSTEVSA